VYLPFSNLDVDAGEECTKEEESAPSYAGVPADELKARAVLGLEGGRRGVCMRVAGALGCALRSSRGLRGLVCAFVGALLRCERACVGFRPRLGLEGRLGHERRRGSRRRVCI
jgi:hypothetical protein